MAKDIVARLHGSYRNPEHGVVVVSPRILVEAAQAIAELRSEMTQRELHHFEAEQALTKIKHHVETALHEYGDDLDHEDVLAMIPGDIK